MKTQFHRALDAAHRSLEDGSIDEIHVRSDHYGFRSILAHSDQGWQCWYSEQHDEEGYPA